MTQLSSFDEADVTHERATVNGVSLHYVTAGPEDGDLVLCLHGFPEFWYSWHHQLPALAEAGYRVVAPDLRGYNRSERPAGVDAYRLEKLVGDVVGLIDHCGRERAHVVGHDWGGLIAWQVGIDRPEVVDRLAVLNAPHPTRYQRHLRSSPSQLAKSWYVFYFQLPILPEIGFRFNDYAVLESTLSDTVRPDAFTDDDIERYKSALATPGALTAAINYYRALGRQRARELLTGGGIDVERVDVPTLLLWGERDVALDVALTEDLDALVPDLRIERYPDASHWVQFDAPERVNDALLGFFED
jgi:pimeloyl-ACP methyl ester carboxylesterase